MQESYSKKESYLEKDSIINFFNAEKENDKFKIDMEFCPFGDMF
jgi:hypothetical protein